MTPRPDLIADSVLNTFRRLPRRFKPRHNGRQEWVPLAGIVLSKDPSSATEDHDPKTPTYNCVALATGMKCHPHNKLPHFHGSVLHDWHAEVLAIRAFNRFLLDECADLAAESLGKGSAWLKWRSRASPGDSTAGVEIEQPFALQDDVAIHMYVSEAPCGDASMELTMRKQEDATPWSTPTSDQAVEADVSVPAPSTTDNAQPMQGRAHFNQLGTVRRKPSRPDAPVTLSKSCSDKLALKQCTGLLSAMTYRFIHPANIYLESLVLPESEYVPVACERAFGVRERMAPLLDVEEGWERYGFAFKPFDVCTTSREFEYSRRYIMQHDPDSALEPVPSNRSCVYTPQRSEVLINGVLEGRRMLDPKGASCVSRRRMWEAAVGVTDELDPMVLSGLSRDVSYGELKAGPAFEGRRKVKHEVTSRALNGWYRNTGDDGWSLSDEERRVSEQRES